MEQGNNINSYKLPICDTQEERRNFEGYEKNQWYSLAELQSGDYAGTTDTDSKTESYNDAGSTSIYKKSGKGGRSWKSSSKKAKGN